MQLEVEISNRTYVYLGKGNRLRTFFTEQFRRIWSKLGETSSGGAISNIFFNLLLLMMWVITELQYVRTLSAIYVTVSARHNPARWARGRCINFNSTSAAQSAPPHTRASWVVQNIISIVSDV